MKFTDLKFETDIIVDGIQARHFFPNGYGVSVVQFPGSYGSEQGLYELAVLHGSAEDYDLCYDTHITDDIMGYLDEVNVENIINKVQSL